MNKMKHPLLIKVFYCLVRIIDNIKSSRWDVCNRNVAR